MSYVDADDEFKARTAWIYFSVSLGLATTAVAVAIVYFHARIALSTHWYTVAVCGVAVLTLTYVFRQWFPTPYFSGFERSVYPVPKEPERPERLERLERQFSLASSNALDWNFWLLPRLRGVARERARTFQGADIESDESMARLLLGDDVCRILWPPEEVVARREGPGVDAAALNRVLRALEGLDSADLH